MRNVKMSPCRSGDDRMTLRPHPTWWRLSRNQSTYWKPHWVTCISDSRLTCLITRMSPRLIGLIVSRHHQMGIHSSSFGKTNWCIPVLSCKLDSLRPTLQVWSGRQARQYPAYKLKPCCRLLHTSLLVHLFYSWNLCSTMQWEYRAWAALHVIFDYA